MSSNDDSVVCVDFDFFCFKQKTAYEMRISDWSSDVCSSDLSARMISKIAEGLVLVIIRQPVRSERPQPNGRASGGSSRTDHKGRTGRRAGCLDGRGSGCAEGRNRWFRRPPAMCGTSRYDLLWRAR